MELKKVLQVEMADAQKLTSTVAEPALLLVLRQEPARGAQAHCRADRLHLRRVGARSLNIELQAALNPAGERKVERFGWTFAPGDDWQMASCLGARSRTA
jgi:hypothetical protein